MSQSPRYTQPKKGAKVPQKEKGMHSKKSFPARYPLVSCLVVAAGIGAGAFIISNSGEDAAGEKEPAARKSREENARERRENLVREKVEKIKKIVQFQKKLVENGWYERRRAEEEEARFRMQWEEQEFMIEVEGKNKEELVGLLIAQNRIIEQLREYAGSSQDPELEHEQKKRDMLQQKLDEIEIAERGLLEKSVEELEGLLLELDKIITCEDYYPIETYIEAMEDRALIAKAIGERRFWDAIVFPELQ